MLDSIAVNGYVTHKPHIAKTKGGTAYALFSIASRRNFTKSDKSEPVTDFLTCVIYGKVVDKFISKYIDKGSLVSVTGRLENSPYQDAKGQMNYDNYQIHVHEISLLPRKSQPASVTGDTPTKSGQDNINPKALGKKVSSVGGGKIDSDSLPF